MSWCSAVKAPINENDDLYASILSISKEGASRKTIAESLSISYPQLRRLTAELVDKGMLHMDVKKRIFITTDKGLIFLQDKKARDV